MYGRPMYGVVSHKRNNGLLKVELSPPKDEDEAVSFFTGAMNDNRIRHYLLRDGSLTANAEQEWIRSQTSNENEMVWFIYANVQLAGSIGFHKIDQGQRIAEAGILLGDQSFWGRGISETAGFLIAEYGFNNVVAEGLHKIFVRILGANLASRTAAKRMGLREIGIKKEQFWRSGRWYDEWNGEILKSEWAEIKDNVQSRLKIVEYKIYPGCEKLHLE